MMDNRCAATLYDAEIARLRSDLRAAAEAHDMLADQLAGAVALLAIFVEGEGDCSLDHHGYCQEHGWIGPGECHVARARHLIGGQ